MTSCFAGKVSCWPEHEFTQEDTIVTDVPANFTTGQIIRHLRERRGMSRTVLAGLVGYSAEWLKRIEAGQRGISLPALLKLARILRVTDLSTFIDGDIPMPVSAWEGPQHPAAIAVRKIVGITSFAPSTRSDPMSCFQPGREALVGKGC